MPEDDRLNPSFALRQHRGFETVTFILDGELMHRDSGGHESAIRAGGVQWMTAGSGLEHAELSPEAFKRAGGLLEILQPGESPVATQNDEAALPGSTGRTDSGSSVCGR